MMIAFTAFCYGIAFAGACSASLFFFRFWRLSRDPFFISFSIAFFLLAAQWLAVVAARPDAETRPYYYFPRLLAFAIIIFAATQKNRRADARARDAMTKEIANRGQDATN